MNLDACIEFGKAIALEQMSIDKTSGWINSRCPMPWHHLHGDRHPSFGIKADSEGPSVWNCFSYGSGPLARLLHTLQWRYKEHYLEASEILTANEIILDRDSDKWREYNDKYAGASVVEDTDIRPIPESVLAAFPKVSGRSKCNREALRYLTEERGIAPSVANKYDVRFSEEMNAVIFPVRNREGRLMFMRARCINTKICFTVSPEHTNAPELVFPGKKSGAMFGMHLVKYDKPVMVVEAELELMKLVTMGFTNVVATCGGISQAQLDRLTYPVILSGYDADPAGEKNAEKLIRKCREYSTLYKVDWSVVGAGDPGDLKTVEQLKEVLRMRTAIQ